MTRALIAAVLLIASLVAPTAARAEEGPFLLRLRGLYLTPANKSDANTGVPLAADAVHVNDRFVPEIDFSYFVMPYLAWSRVCIR